MLKCATVAANTVEFYIDSYPLETKFLLYLGGSISNSSTQQGSIQLMDQFSNTSLSPHYLKGLLGISMSSPQRLSVLCVTCWFLFQVSIPTVCLSVDWTRDSIPHLIYLLLGLVQYISIERRQPMYYYYQH